MRIENLWKALEAEAVAGKTGASGWLLRLVDAKSTCLLSVALELATRHRALLLRLTSSQMPPRREWPECRGLEIISVALGSEPHLGVLLRDGACADVFAALAEDVAPRVAAASGSKQATAELLGRLRRWQKFLTAARDLLSIEAQRGLWGELHVLRTHLLPALGAVATVAGWNASAAAHQDFQFSRGAVEVKTTAAKQPQSVRITSERQLDDTGVGALFLHVVVVDEREVPAGRSMPGQSLPAIIADVRTQLSADLTALAAFNDRLLDRGWLDAHAGSYEARRWTVRGERTYKVQPGFPRLVEVDLPSGVGDVNFAVSLAACEPFAEPVSAMLTGVSQTNSPHRSRPLTS